MKRLVLLLGLALFVPSAGADEPVKKELTKYDVPYRLTVPKHIHIRAKINGKGPYNFILDTGAPALFIATKVSDQLGIKGDKNGWGKLDRFEIEGGVVLEKTVARLETPFQLEGMNGMGLAGCELHGIIGYSILAQFRMEIDLTRDKMTWTKLDWKPKDPMGIGGKGGGQGGLEVFGSIMKLLGGFLGRKAEPDLAPRGFLGMEIAEDDGTAVVKSIFPDGPAAKAGLKPGDRFVKFRGRSVYGSDGLEKFTSKVQAGEVCKIVIKRGKDGGEMDLVLKVGEGF